MCIAFFVTWGVTQVNDLHAILHIPVCQVPSHTSSIPSLRWFTFWPHEVTKATRWVYYTCAKNVAQLKPQVGLSGWWRDKDAGHHQLYGLTGTQSFSHPSVDFCTGCVMAEIVSLALNQTIDRQYGEIEYSYDRGATLIRLTEPFPKLAHELWVQYCQWWMILELNRQLKSQKVQKKDKLWLHDIKFKDTENTQHIVWEP